MSSEHGVDDSSPQSGRVGSEVRQQLCCCRRVFRRRQCVDGRQLKFERLLWLKQFCRYTLQVVPGRQGQQTKRVTSSLHGVLLVQRKASRVTVNGPHFRDLLQAEPPRYLNG